MPVPEPCFPWRGHGEALNEIATGYEGAWPEFKERFARLRESVGLMRQLWSGDRVDFDGDYYRLKGASIYDVPDGGRARLHRRRRPGGGQVRRPRR